MKKFYLILIALLIVNGAMAQWFPQNSGTINNLNSVFFTDASTGYAVGDSGIILRTIDGGAIWANQISVTDSVLTSVFFPASDTGYLVGNSGIILRETDGGINWMQQNSNTTNNLNSVYFTDANTGYAVAGNAILKTTNGGENWIVNYLDTTTFLKSVYFTDNNTGYAAGSKRMGWDVGAIIIKTINGGEDWLTNYSYSSPTFNCIYFSVYFADSITGFAGGRAYGYFGWPISIQTLDGGIEWTGLSAGIDPQSFHFPNADTGYAVSGSYIVKTTDGGSEWLDQISGTTNGLNSVYFTDANTGYIVGDDGTILKTTNGGGLPVGINNRSLTSNAIKIYPNPSSTTITISMPATPDKNTFMTINNINGQALLSRQITEQQTVVDVSGLNVGVYFVKVADDRTVKVGKFVKK
jgi:photosystem II stability/assembly factor-like uncharacterized protein